jgi:hypothetical protein
VSHSPVQVSLTQPYILTELEVSRIGARVAEQFCLLLTGVITNMLFRQGCSRNTSETMLSVGSTGQKIMDFPSIAWKTSYSSTGVQWSLHGLRPRSMTTLRKHKFLWRQERLITEGQVFIGAIIVGRWIITTASLSYSTQFGPFWSRLLAVC